MRRSKGYAKSIEWLDNRLAMFFALLILSIMSVSYLFLNEITYKKDFSVQLKNIYDLYNAKFKDRRAYLTGWERITEILPLDFEEFLRFKNIKIKKADKHLS